MDDISNGKPGIGFYLENQSSRWAMERAAYLQEIRLARELGDTRAQRLLVQSAWDERAYIFGLGQ